MSITMCIASQSLPGASVQSKDEYFLSTTVSITVLMTCDAIKQNEMKLANADFEI